MTDAAHRAEQRKSDKEERAENLKPEVLRTYAFLFEQFLGSLVAGTMQTSFPPEVYIAAAKALRLQADAMERGAEY